MPITINLDGRYGIIRVPGDWQKPCEAGQWGLGVLAVAITPIPNPYGLPWKVDAVPVGLASDGAGGVFVLTRSIPNLSQDGPFALQPISATGRPAALVEFGGPRAWIGLLGFTPEGAVVPSGSGRCIFAWANDYAHLGVVAQRYDQNGQPLWNNGNPITASTMFGFAGDGSGVRSNLLAEPDGKGGAIIAWLRPQGALATGNPIQIQRIDANGNALWGSDGISQGTVDVGSFGGWSVVDPGPWVQLVPDGKGGAFMITCEAGNNCVVYTIQANGIVRGAPATLTSMSAESWVGAQRIRRAVTDGKGGLFFSYVDAHGQLRVLRYTSANGILWDGGFGTPMHGTAFHVREDDRDGLLVSSISPSPTPRLNVLRIDGNGQITWSINPAISLIIPSGSPFWSTDQLSRLAQAVPDGNGGAVLVYQDFPIGNVPKLFSICFDSTGQPVSPAQEVSARASAQELPLVVAVGRSSALVAWANDDFARALEVYVQRIGCCPPSRYGGLDLYPGQPWPRFGCEIIQFPGLGYKEMFLNFPCVNRERRLGVIPLTRLFANVRGLDYPGSIFNRDVAAPDWLRISFSRLPPGTDVRLYSMKGKLLAEGKPLKGARTRKAERAQRVLTFKPSQKEDQLLVFSNMNKLEPESETVSIRLSSDWGSGKVPPAPRMISRKEVQAKRRSKNRVSI